MSNCVHDNGEYCEVFSDKEVRQPCLETPLCEEYKAIVRCKDCKYWAEFTFAQPPKNYCGRPIQADYNNHNFGFEMDADDFCSRGELK